MPRQKKSSKKPVQTENYIILILWLMVASTFAVLGYLTNALGIEAQAGKRQIRLEKPIPTSNPYNKPTQSMNTPEVWPVPSTVDPESHEEILFPGMEVNPSKEIGR